MVSALHPRAYRRRSRERGAAVFIVIVVIAMLTAVGLFAAKSATLSMRSSGHERQMVQTHYVTEFAMLTTLAELSTPRREAFLREMSANPAANCEHFGGGSLPNYTCYRMGYSDLEALLQVQNPDQRILCRDASDTNCGAAWSGTTPGSLGAGNLDSDFKVEVADLAPAAPPIEGMDIGGTGPQMQYYSVTVSASGLVRPYDSDTSVASIDLNQSISSTVEYSRAQVTVGPIPTL